MIITSNFAKIWMILLPWLWMFSRMTTEGSLIKGTPYFMILSNFSEIWTHFLILEFWILTTQFSPIVVLLWWRVPGTDFPSRPCFVDILFRFRHCAAQSNPAPQSSSPQPIVIIIIIIVAAERNHHLCFFTCLMNPEMFGQPWKWKVTQSSSSARCHHYKLISLDENWQRDF